MSELRIGMVGAGTMAGAHSAALVNLPHLYRDLALRPRLVAVADINGTLATGLADRFGYERVAADWRALVEADDVDLVVACLPPAFNREVVLGPRRPASTSCARSRWACRRTMPPPCSAPARPPASSTAWPRGIAGRPPSERSPGSSATASWARSGASGPRSCSTMRPTRTSPSCGASARPSPAAGSPSTPGYHLVDCARFLVGEIETVQALSATFITERALPGADAVGNRGGTQAAGAGRRETGPVDVEDAAAALITFCDGAYGVLETSRVAIGKRVSLQIEVYGARGSAEWDLESPDEFRLCLPGDPFTFGFRRVLVNPGHPGAAELLIAGTDGTSIGWLGQECAMWAEFLGAIAEGRPGSADFSDGVRDSAVIDALYAAAASGARTAVVLPAGL